MFVREAPVETLATVMDSLAVPRTRLEISGSEVHFDMTNHTIGLGRKEVPLTEQGLLAFGNYCSIPESFMKRMGDCEPQLQADVIERMLGATTAAVFFNEVGIDEVRDARKGVIEPTSLVMVLMDVLDSDAPVIDWFRSTQGFQVDTVVPEGFDRGIGGDKPTKRAVGDITKGGLRAGIDTKRGLAPWVQPFMYRLVCTNGQECEDPTLTIDARGDTIDDVLDAFHDLANTAFTQVEQDIKAFYELRHQPVENIERTLLRIGKERGIADRFLTKILNAATTEDVPDNPSMFDVVNLITNEANNPEILRRRGTRRKLEQIGGAVTTEHAARCHHCQSKLR
jgi:hypothetical protein